MPSTTATHLPNPSRSRAIRKATLLRQDAAEIANMGLLRTLIVEVRAFAKKSASKRKQ